MPTVRSASRTVAIVPAHEPDEDDLRACVLSIVNQRDTAVDEIHVVDDGSVRNPVRPFRHPRVHWHRTDHGGPVAAQVYVLDRLRPPDWDFVLTVDAAWSLDDRAVARQLREFSRPGVAATSGTVLVRGAGEDLPARIAELRAGAACAASVAGRALLGILDRTAGAPAVYRADVLFKYRDQYLAEGDDRCAALYAAMEGEVVGVTGSVAWSRAPIEPTAAYRLRLEWSRQWWRMLPAVLTAMRPTYRVILPVAGVMWLAAAPLMVGWLLAAGATCVVRGQPPGPAMLLAPAAYLLIRYVVTALHLARRPGLNRRAKLMTWLLLTPAAAVHHLVRVAPVKYLGLLTVSGYRRDTHPSRGPAAGVLYQSGHAVWR